MSKSYVVPCSLSSAHVDWVTTTGASEESQRSLWELGNALLEVSEAEDQPPSRWHGHGYSGWSVAGVRLASRPDSVLLQLSGQKSRDNWIKAIAASENCSRLDLAVDSHFDPPRATLIRELYRKVGRHEPSSGRIPRRTIWASSDGGATLYVGARVSENFGRVYDKGIEQKTAPSGSWWRWEVELKGNRSKVVSVAMETAHAGPAEIAGTVASWFRSRLGAAPSLASTNFNHIGPSEERSVDRQLRWLASGVRPTVLKLCDVVGRQRVLAALGLSPTGPECSQRPDLSAEVRRCPQQLAT